MHNLLILRRLTLLVGVPFRVFYASGILFSVTGVDSAAAQESAGKAAPPEIQSRHAQGKDSSFDPATFVVIYEDTKAGGRIKVHDPRHSHRMGIC